MTTADSERYQILKRLDKGGMAEVFLGRSSGLEGFDKAVAIKRVLPNLAANEKFVRMFLDEAKLSLHLDHANIVSVFDVGMSAGTYFIVMEYIDGTNLKKLLDSGPIPVELACYILIEVCKGLVYAHGKVDRDGRPLNIVHRDISPPNILLSREGEVKVTDFGLARAVSQLESTDPGVVKGKFAYLSPEAAWGEEVDLRTDVFAAGIVLWEAVTGRRLFQGDTDLGTLESVRRAEVPSVTSINPKLPSGLDAILARALARDPVDRYASARDFGRELSLFLVEERISVTAYDLSAWLKGRLDDQQEPERISPTLAEKLVQEELAQFIRLHDESQPAKPDPNAAVPDSFEDPRSWGVFEAGDEQRGVFGTLGMKIPDGMFDDVDLGGGSQPGKPSVPPPRGSASGASRPPTRRAPPAPPTTTSSVSRRPPMPPPSRNSVATTMPAIPPVKPPSPPQAATTAAASAERSAPRPSQPPAAATRAPARPTTRRTAAIERPDLSAAPARPIVSQVASVVFIGAIAVLGWLILS